MGLAVAAVVLLAARGPSVQAQPVASITLPAPGAGKDLYPGCNNIGLTFPNGTASQDVVQAVTPAGSVESMWRHNAVQDRFEGFSPQYPQVSDLLAVDFLDAVWFCMTTGAPPGGVAPPGPTATATPPGGTQPPQPPPPPPPPAPPGVTADVSPTDLYPDNQPQGSAWVRITNNGPDTLTNHKVDLTVVETRSSLSVPPTAQSAQGPAVEYILNLAPGQTQDINLGWQFDLSQYDYKYVVSVAAKDFTDPTTSNDSYTEAFPTVPPPPPPGGGSWGITTADLAVTDLFIKPNTEVWFRITNNGPDSLSNISINETCTMVRTPWGTQTPDGTQTTAGPITITVSPGQTQEFNTGFQSFVTTQWKYKVTCSISVGFKDTVLTNNTYFEYFPPPP
jgi:hypothetical protein